MQFLYAFRFVLVFCKIQLNLSRFCQDWHTVCSLICVTAAWT